jgi:dihydropteroate synthase
MYNKVREATDAGVKDIITDVGFGFGKTIEHNFQLLKNLRLMQIPGYPMLAGISRKGMIWKSLDITPDQALNGTTALHMMALVNGAGILRVHDVKEATECIKLFQMLNQA